MNTIIHFFMFAIGVVFGSFYTLAVYRIPLKQDITHTRSYCPKCNHRLEFWDLIPVLSYIFLGGKCRYCKERIRPRYLVLEVLSGISFLLFSMWLNIDLLHIEYYKIATLVFGILFFTAICIIIGIFKDYKKVEKSVFNFGLIIESLYIIYLYILDTSIYRYIIYFCVLIAMFVLNNVKKTNEKLRIILFIIFVIIGISEILIIH